MFSACAALLYRTYLETWKRGEDYANRGKVKLVKFDDSQAIAKVSGTKKYQVSMLFRGNGISRHCDCPVKDFCKHLVATAIIWDEARGINRPTAEEMEDETIPPPAISHSQVSSAYKDPLNADLDVIRIAADELGWGGRPHARLPNQPKFSSDLKQPLTLEEVRKSFREIASWANRRNYDLYFCAGEMVAAFCEIMRLTKKRLGVTSSTVSAEILREAQKFHYRLIIDLIDDSNGLHEFTEAHLEDIYQSLKNDQKADSGNTFKEKLEEFNCHRDDY